MMWIIEINRLSFSLAVIMIMPLIILVALYSIEFESNIKKHERILIVVFGVMFIISFIVYTITDYIGG